jgi:hypothetical protein
MVLGLRTDIEGLRTVVRPSHGILGSSDKEGNLRFMAYAPQTGFIGSDRFEVDVQYRPPGRPSMTTRMKIQINVVP